MSRPLWERYNHYDASGVGRWEPIAPSDDSLRVPMLLGLYKHLYPNGPEDDEQQLSPEFTEDERAVILAAKKFVEEQTGLVVDCKISKVSTPSKTMGKYSHAKHAIQIRGDTSTNDYQRAISYGSTHVHEMVHSVGAQVMEVATLAKPGEPVDIIRISPFDIYGVTPAYESENFFYEALAEEAASRWRERCDELLLGKRRHLAHLGRISLPVRLYEGDTSLYQADERNKMLVSLPGLAAFGVQMLSEYSGTDLYQLMIQSLHPGSSRQAVAELRIVIDGIEPGLYDVLTAARYTGEDYLDCLEIIRHAIANHAHEQHAHVA